MSELLFECYRVPSVSYGVDGLFSFRHNHPTCTSALIINIGYHTTHILPVINNCIDPSRSRRINVGGLHIVNFLHRLLQLKYPAHFAAITPSRAEVTILLYLVFVLVGWSLLPNALQPFQIYCDPPNSGITRT